LTRDTSIVTRFRNDTKVACKALLPEREASRPVSAVDLAADATWRVNAAIGAGREDAIDEMVREFAELEPKR
jgi:hypothetical protein